jgi:hypothetical protein
MTKSKKDRALVVVVVDRSGSMAKVQEEAEAAVNKYVADRADDKAKVDVVLKDFDTEYTTVFGPVRAADAPTYSLEPRGMTALYDALGRALSDTALVASAAKKPYDKVVVTIMTDGFENASQEYDLRAITEAVEQAKARDWQIVFLAGTLRARDMAYAVGLRGSTVSFHGDNAHAHGHTYAVASASTRSYLADDSDKVDVPTEVADDGTHSHDHGKAGTDPQSHTHG